MRHKQAKKSGPKGQESYIVTVRDAPVSVQTYSDNLCGG